MTPLPATPLVKALQAMIQASVGNACPIYLAKATEGAQPPYAVVYPDSGILSPTRRTLANNGPNELRYRITSVGATWDQALWVADKTSYAVLTNTLAVPGRRVWPTVEEGSQPIQRDNESTGLFYATAQYLNRSDPA